MSEPKRPRGRPKNPDEAWVWVGKKGDEVFARILASAEEDRRGAVGEKVREAYDEGRNTANKNRATERRNYLDHIRLKEKELIENHKLTSTSVANHLHKAGRGYGVAPDTLRKYISEIRKNSGTAKLSQK